MTFVSLEDAGVTLPVFGPNGLSLRSKVSSVIKSDRSAGDNSVAFVEALGTMTIDFREGDRVGLRGQNGAGKSTLLRLVGGVYQPSSGRIVVEGTRRCLFGLASGMEPEGTGWENIRIGARRIGVAKRDLDSACEDVAEFSELGASLDRPLRTYSQGMKLRLSFGVMTCKPADILLIDEVIGVGDADFMEKANERMKRFTDQARIMIMASHSNEVIERFCNQILTLEAGRIRKRIYWDLEHGESAPPELPEETSRSCEVIRVADYAEVLDEIGLDPKRSRDSEEVSACKAELAGKPYEWEAHLALGRQYREEGDDTKAWLQFRNVISLAEGTLDEKTREELRNSMERFAQEGAKQFHWSLSSAAAAVGNQLERFDNRGGLCIDLDSHWLDFSLRLEKRRWLTFHRDLNGLELEALKMAPESIEWVGSFGPAAPAFRSRIGEMTRVCSEALDCPVILWVRWTGPDSLARAEVAMTSKGARKEAHGRFLDLAGVRALGDELNCQVCEIEEGDYLAAVSEYTAAIGAVAGNEQKSRIRTFFERVDAELAGKRPPHGHVVVLNPFPSSRDRERNKDASGGANPAESHPNLP